MSDSWEPLNLRLLGSHDEVHDGCKKFSHLLRLLETNKPTQYRWSPPEFNRQKSLKAESGAALPGDRPNQRGRAKAPQRNWVCISITMRINSLARASDTAHQRSACSHTRMPVGNRQEAALLVSEGVCLAFLPSYDAHSPRRGRRRRVYNHEGGGAGHSSLTVSQRYCVLPTNIPTSNGEIAVTHRRACSSTVRAGDS